MSPRATASIASAPRASISLSLLISFLGKGWVCGSGRGEEEMEEEEEEEEKEEEVRISLKVRLGSLLEKMD